MQTEKETERKRGGGLRFRLFVFSWRESSDLDLAGELSLAGKLGNNILTLFIHTY